MSVTARIKQPIGVFEENTTLAQVHRMPRWILQIVVLGSLLISSLLFGLAYFFQRPKLRTMAWLFAVLFAISMIVSKLNHDYLNQFRYAVVVKERVGIRQDPKIENLEIDYLSEGVTVKLLDQKDGWSYIELPNKLVGWVLSPMIEKI